MSELVTSLKNAHVEFLFSGGSKSTLKPADKIEVLAGDPISLSFIQSQDGWRGGHGKIANTGNTVTLEGRFLDWVPGYVSICNAGQGTVFSGPFSGCWYIKFFHAGQYHVAHVGTTGTQSIDDAVKQAFGEYSKSLPDLHQATFFKPNRAWTDNQLKEFMVGYGGKTRAIYILSTLEPDGDCHAMCLGRTEDSEKTFQMKVSGTGQYKLPTRFGNSKPAFQDKWTEHGANQKPLNTVSVTPQYEVLDIKKLAVQRWNDVKGTGFLK